MCDKWDKTRLENLIFYLAARQGSCLLSFQGRLNVKNRCSVVLGELLNIYNLFFEQENLRFLKQEILETKRENKSFRLAFAGERAKYPLQKSFFLAGVHKKG